MFFDLVHNDFPSFMRELNKNLVPMTLKIGVCKTKGRFYYIKHMFRPQLSIFIGL